MHVIILMFKNFETVATKCTQNPGSYDDCAERALVNRLLEVFKCSVISSKETVLKTVIV